MMSHQNHDIFSCLIHISGTKNHEKPTCHHFRIVVEDRCTGGMAYLEDQTTSRNDWNQSDSKNDSKCRLQNDDLNILIYDLIVSWKIDWSWCQRIWGIHVDGGEGTETSKKYQHSGTKNNRDQSSHEFFSILRRHFTRHWLHIPLSVVHMYRYWSVDKNAQKCTMGPRQIY